VRFSSSPSFFARLWKKFMTAKKSCYEIISFFSLFSSSSPKTTTIIGGIYEAHGAVLPLSGVFLLRRQHSATTAHRALPVCEWPALGMPWGTARSNAASAVCSRCDGACTGGGCGRAGRVVCGGCGFAGLWRFPEEEAALGNHSAQSPASV